MHTAKQIYSWLGPRIPWQLRMERFSQRTLMDTLFCLRILEDPEAEVALDHMCLHILSLITPGTLPAISQYLSPATHLSFLQIPLKTSFLTNRFSQETPRRLGLLIPTAICTDIFGYHSDWQALLAFTSIYFWHSGSEMLSGPQWAEQSAHTQCPSQSNCPYGEALHQSLPTFLFSPFFSMPSAQPYPTAHSSKCLVEEEKWINLSPQEDNLLSWDLTSSDPGSPSFLAHWELCFVLILLHTLHW